MKSLFLFRKFFTIIVMLLATIALYATPSYTCPTSETVANLDGTTVDVLVTDSSSRIAVGGKGARYFKFKTAINGEITIRQKNNYAQSGYFNHWLKIGYSCDDSSIYSAKGRDESHTFNVVANTTYYVKVQEGNTKNELNFDISFDFKTVIKIGFEQATYNILEDVNIIE
ncbi:MAG: hypothetical protein J7L21_04385, partial [Sulfurimonas sp.]|nr:hypothetical protein [Sulfurimonas sp.]